MKKELLGQGLFPETLPPCFTSVDCTRAFRGLSQALSEKKFHKRRSAEPISYNGTKHDGSRRPYATPHPIAYYYICEFIHNNWKYLANSLATSPYSISGLRAAPKDGERAIIVTPLSEVAAEVSAKIRYSPYILKADIAQFYPSIYTHSISWAAHGKTLAKAERNYPSKKARFNHLDFFTQNAQSGQTRGLLIGPDAYRIIAEFIAVQVDKDLQKRCSDQIIGAGRHVDDFYIGVRSEVDAALVLSKLRESLQEYELQLNDLKTAILPGTHQLDDVWATRLRLLGSALENNPSKERVQNFFDEALLVAQSTKSQSPIKFAIRRVDHYKLYRDPHFEYIENILQRLIFHFPHAIDYICLLIAKRIAIKLAIDQAGWSEVVNAGLRQHLFLGNHHEACWLFWLGVCASFQIPPDVVDEITRQGNMHLKAQLVQANADGKLSRKPKIPFSNNISSTNRSWLLNIVAKTTETTKAPFSGSYTEECNHLVAKNIRFIDFEAHAKKVASRKVRAISNLRFGYEDSDDDEDEDFADALLANLNDELSDDDPRYDDQFGHE